jgi:hypothetical protein
MSEAFSAAVSSDPKACDMLFQAGMELKTVHARPLKERLSDRVYREIESLASPSDTTLM